jgi:hypothetical protein
VIGDRLSGRERIRIENKTCARRGESSESSFKAFPGKREFAAIRFKGGLGAQFAIVVREAASIMFERELESGSDRGMIEGLRELAGQLLDSRSIVADNVTALKA